MVNLKRKIWLIGDTHFNHKKMIGDLGRPANFEELIWKGLEKVGKEDILIHLGDICVGEDEKINSRIGKFGFKKYLVRGNHDGKSNNWYLNHGWDFVCQEFRDKYFGQEILFSHMPADIKKDYEINIHAHFHNISEEFHEKELIALKNKKQKLFAQEYLGYEPILLKDFLN